MKTLTEERTVMEQKCKEANMTSAAMCRVVAVLSDACARLSRIAANCIIHGGIEDKDSLREFRALATGLRQSADGLDAVLRSMEKESKPYEK